jgi:hypothetical protein
MMLGGCATSGKAPVARSLPPPPEFLKPVPTPDVKSGMDARVVAAQGRKSLSEANDRLDAGRSWYEGVRSRYQGAK